MKSLHALFAIVPLALPLAACAHDYVYVPATNSSATVAGRPAAEYPIPAEAPRGDVRIASYGIVHVSAQNAGDQHLTAIHLRVVVANNGADAWTVDTRDQRLDLEGRGTSAPAFASADPGTPPPLVTIPSRGKRVIDLFFPLPADLQDADELPMFDAEWRVNIGSRVVTERTPFERLGVDAAPAYATYDGPYDYGGDYYWGPNYWYNPLYPRFSFRGGVVIAPHYYGGRPLIIHRAPFRGRGGHFGGGGHHR